MTQLSSDFVFKKKFGQNFIFDKNFILSIVKGFELSKNSSVLEVGAGAGVLTEVLAENFKNVVSFEIDETLINHLSQLKEKYNNLDFVFKDVLNIDTKEIDDMFKDEYFLIANLPYYITSQIIFKFLIESEKLNKMYVMVQKEVGERFCAVKDTKEYGIPTVVLNSLGSCKIVKNVSRTVFRPIPNVDSCIIEIDIDRNKFQIENRKDFNYFVSNCFRMKRKTLCNNLLNAGFNKDKIILSLFDLGFHERVRPENLSAEDFVNLYDKLKS